jgi:hypothetical protein
VCLAAVSMLSRSGVLGTWRERRRRCPGVLGVLLAGLSVYIMMPLAGGLCVASVLRALVVCWFSVRFHERSGQHIARVCHNVRN